MSNEALPSGLALTFFIGGLLMTAGGIGLLVRYLRLGRPKAAVEFENRRQGVYISLVTVIFGGLLATGGGYFYFAPDGPEWLRWLVGLLFFAECLGCILFQKVVLDSWRSQLSAEWLELEHQQVIHDHPDRPNGL